MRHMITFGQRARAFGPVKNRYSSPVLVGFGLIAAILLSACQSPNNPAQVNRALQSVHDVDNTNIADVMLTLGKPDEAVAYFTQAVAADPTNLTAQRGLGKSLTKAGRAGDAAQVWAKIIAMPEATHEDRVNTGFGANPAHL